ncbi:MAG: GAF domain-containing protein [Chloroflexi bacterium]|nr:GAF domain-containing protein [Chloroflexota bacterium]
MTKPMPDEAYRRYRGRLRWAKLAAYLLTLAGISGVEYYYYAYMHAPLYSVLIGSATTVVAVIVLIELTFFLISRAGRALQRDRQFLAEHNSELLAVYETGALLSSTPNLTEVLDVALDRIPLSPNVSAAIVKFDAGRRMGRVVAARGLQRDQIKGIEIPQGDVPENLRGIVAQQKQPLAIPDLRAMARQHHQRLTARLPVLGSTKSLVLFPLLGRSQMLGLLVLSSPDAMTLTEPQYKMLTTFSRQLAAAFEAEQLTDAVSEGRGEWEAIADALDEGIFLVDADRNIIRANRALAGLVGREREELIGRKYYEVLYGSSTPPIDCLSDEAGGDGTPSSTETEAVLNGRTLRLRCSCIYDLLGVPTGAVFALRDVTEQKLSQEESQRHSRESRLLNTLMLRAGASAELPSTLSATLQELIGISQSEAGWIYLAGNGSGNARVAASYGLSPEAQQEINDYGAVLTPRFAQDGDEPFVIEDMAAQPDLSLSSLLGEGWQSAIVVPLRSRGNLMGQLGLAGRERRTLEERDLHLLKGVSSYLAVTIENALLLEQTRREAERWAWMTGFTRQLASSLELSQALEASADGVASALSSPTATVDILLFDRQRGVFQTVAGRGPHGGELVGREFRVADFPAELVRAFMEEHSVIASWDGSEVPDALRQLIDAYCPGSWLGIPLVSKGEVIGAIAIGDSAPISPESEQVKSVQTLAGAVAIALDNARLYESEKENASKLQEMDQLRTGFLRTILHELRTPLSSLKVSVDLLRESGDSGIGSEHYARLLANANRSVTRLDRLVSDLTDISSLATATLSLNREQCDIQGLVAEAVGMMIPLVTSKRQTLDVDVPESLPDIVVDRQRFGQVLGNLLSNAQKFSPMEAHLELRVRQEESDAIFEVHDDGPGIPREEQQLIFEPFYRADPGPNHRAAGTGLGLAIAKSLVEMHGGRIWVESEVGKGASFFFSMPLEGRVSS